MLYLFLCVLANVGIFTCFRAFKRFEVDTFPAIVINYFVCVITGSLFAGFSNLPDVLEKSGEWIIYAVVLGTIFIGTFYLMARTTQVFSMTVSSVATKMSLVIPVLFSLLILEIQSREYSLFNFLGMFIALLAITASSIKRNGTQFTTSHFINYLLPFSIFILGGIIDSTINYVSFRFLGPEEESIFPIVIFASAAVIGFCILLIKKKQLDRKVMIGGLVLGVVNYFSVYYLVKSLSSFQHDGAIVYPLINVGIILFSSGVSVTFFREKLSILNITGIIFAVIAILLLSHQELFASI